LIVVVVGLAVVLALGVLMQPWRLIASPLSNDPDEAYWLVRERFVAIIWAGLAMFTIACVVRIICHRRWQKTDGKPVA
jgi:hypothetical protein